MDPLPRLAVGFLLPRERVRSRSPTCWSTSSQDQRAFRALSLAVFFDQDATAAALIQAGATVGMASDNKLQIQAIHAAVARTNLKALDMLLKAGADPDAEQEGMQTPLNEAAAAGRQDLVERLLKAGAKKSHRDADGKTAADHATKRGFLELARILAPEATN